MNRSEAQPELSVRLRRSDLVAASPDRVGPEGGHFMNLMKYPG
ncbi:hypothetical protein Oter_3579 [Opitutus terrae PB90-1]|uniref:Uncharacterized protein n=1 Tax=Opitutus terrae (strain DSM 11246 / JCM 15787 / PB90-1) TaxID=452637 RepID=B1ZWA4_OPITP|nr:hypothetical protein Oter_3579 [Opitutus terrae PB90-1]